MKQGSRFRIASLGAALACATACFATNASAEESAYCEKVRARASSDAALLFAPSVQAQGIKFPQDGRVDTGVTVGAGYQFRAGLSISPLDVYKGVRVKRVGEADCGQHEVVLSAREVLAQASELGRLPALEKQTAFLEAKQPELDALVAKTEERLAAHVISITEAAEIRGRAAAVVRAREQHRGEADRLRIRNTEAFRGSISELVAKAEKETMHFEREVSHVRTLDAWDVRVTGGVVPQDKPVDFYGMVMVGFNFGSFSRNAAESRYLSARERELATARYELRSQLGQFRAQVKSATEQAKRELAIVDKQAAMLAADKQTIEQADPTSGHHALAVIALDSVLVESERVYLTNLINELARLENPDVR